MVAALFAPKYILIHTFTHPDRLPGTVLCRLLTGGSLSWVGGASSVFTLVVIAIERYYAVMHPYGNKGKLTNRKLKVNSRLFVFVKIKNKVAKLACVA